MSERISEETQVGIKTMALVSQMLVNSEQEASRMLMENAHYLIGQGFKAGFEAGKRKGIEINGLQVKELCLHRP